MTDRCKVKLTHSFDGGDSLTCEAWVDASSLDQAKAEAMNRFKEMAKQLSAMPGISIAKLKIEMGGDH